MEVMKHGWVALEVQIGSRACGGAGVVGCLAMMRVLGESCYYTTVTTTTTASVTRKMPTEDGRFEEDGFDLFMYDRIKPDRILLDPFQFPYPKRRLTMEEIVNKFIKEGKREHEKMDAFIRDTSEATTEAPP
ncbi:hypothetical protein Tco_0111311 [Tanacetum coccineum]